ncbi:DUF4190 domain-containing protein [Agromyces sp. NPDC058484]|uniref:DUF4190 domain-containing protein n=1 Tax=Agromyces sp. NPDC058484 TaxID=3346524 RepID=UPI00364D3A4D
MTDPNLPDQPGAPVPPASQPAPTYGAPAAPAYGESAPAYGQPAGPKTNVLAIVSLVASIAGFIIWGIGFVAGVICGHISLSQIKKTGEQGRGMAVAGLIIGYIGIALTILGAIIFFAVFAAILSNPNLTTTTY